MASAFPAGDLSGHAEFGEGSSPINSLHPQFRSPPAGILASSPPISHLKRPLTQLGIHQQQSLLHRSVKQRTLLSTPMLNLSLPVDFSSQCPEIVNQNRIDRFDSEPEKEKMKSHLQELEKQLFDDDDDEDGVQNCSAASAQTASEWGEIVQDLISPKSFPISPSASSSSTVTASSSPPPATDSGFSCKKLLIDSAEAISDGRMAEATSILTSLKASLACGETEHRLTAHMVGALLSSISPAEGGGGSAIEDLYSTEHLAATRMLLQKSPIFNVALFAADLAVVEAIGDRPKIHIVDFDVGDGTRYAHLLKALAHRRPDKMAVKITALADPGLVRGVNTSAIPLINERMTRFAQIFGINLRFAVLRQSASNLSRESIGCRPDEAVVVSFPFRLSRVVDESVSTANPRDGLLRAAKALSPAVVTLAEQELNTNTAPLRARLDSAWVHYHSLIDSLDSTMAHDGQDRASAERCLGRRAANSVAGEGAGRIERCEVFGKWRARMGMAGFAARRLGPELADSVRLRLQSSSNGSKFFTKEENGAIFIGWKDQILSVVSAWH